MCVCVCVCVSVCLCMAVYVSACVILNVLLNFTVSKQPTVMSCTHVSVTSSLFP